MAQSWVQKCWDCTDVDGQTDLDFPPHGPHGCEGLRDPALGISRQDIEVELIAFGVRHAAPPEPFEFSSRAGLEPNATQLLDFGRRDVKVIYDEIEMDPVLTCLLFWDALKANGEPLFGWRQEQKLALPDSGIDVDTEQATPKRREDIRVDGVNR